MRDFINLCEQLDSDELKFWFNSNTGEFIPHTNDFHHIKVVAQFPELFALSPDEVAHHPHASGEYGDSGAADDGDWEDNSFDGEEWADNNDMGLYSKVMNAGWVRGGHHFDVMTYHDTGIIRNEGQIYLEGTQIKALRKAVAACMKQWPENESFMIENPDPKSFFQLKTAEEIQLYVKYGKITTA